MSNYHAMPSTGDPEKDREQLDRFAQMDARLDAGICANACAPLAWDTEYTAHCPVCDFRWSTNLPYGKRDVNDQEM